MAQLPVPLDTATKNTWGQSLIDIFVLSMNQDGSLNIWTAEPTTNKAGQVLSASDNGYRGYNTTEKVIKEFVYPNWIKRGISQTDIQTLITSAVNALPILNPFPRLASDPTTNASGAALSTSDAGYRYFNTTDSELKEWSGTAWLDLGYGKSAIINLLTEFFPADALVNFDDYVNALADARIAASGGGGGGGGGSSFTAPTILTGNAVDFNTGDFFLKSITAATTFTFTNVSFGKRITIRTLNTAANQTITFPANCEIAGIEDFDYTLNAVNYIQVYCYQTGVSPKFVVSIVRQIRTS